MTEPAETLYRFFAAFPGFGENLPLGYESACTDGGSMWKNHGLGAVFSVDAPHIEMRKYVNGTGITRGMCTVTLLARDNDTDARLRAASLLTALCDDVTSRGRAYTAPGSGCEYRIRAAAMPTRTFRYADGAAWEIRFIYERNGKQCD